MSSKIDQQMLKQPHHDEIEQIRAQVQQVLQNHITMMALITNIRNNRHTIESEQQQKQQQYEQAQQPLLSMPPPLKKRAIRNSKGKAPADEADESKENMPAVDVPSAQGVDGQELAELPNKWLANTDDLLKMIGYSAIIGGIAELVGLPATLASLLT